MKRFKEYITEKFVTADKIIPDHESNKRKYTEIFKNPTAKELSDVYRMSDYSKDEARGVIDNKGNLYVWTNDVIHDKGIKLLNTTKGINLNIDSIKLTFKDGIPIHIKQNVVYLSERFHPLAIRKNQFQIEDLYSKANKKTPYLDFVQTSISNALGKAGYSQLTS